MGWGMNGLGYQPYAERGARSSPLALCGARAEALAERKRKLINSSARGRSLRQGTFGELLDREDWIVACASLGRGVVCCGGKGKADSLRE